MAEKYTVLAPAGDFDAVMSAVNNGADAVYLGLDSFNARMKAENFSAGTINQVVNYCHLFGVKVYVTVNTSVKNNELNDAKKAVLTAYNACADGVIVTDVALLAFASSLPKPFEVVASTQLNCHDGYGARFLKNLGATTVVAARESTYESIREMKNEGVNVEAFIHGALCVCQSGQCLLSSIVGGNSGNRGLCAQPCRKKYTCVQNGKSGYLLSTKDLCGVSFADKLLNSGATTFKIEGRNRRAEYAGMASAVYKRVFEHNCENDDLRKLKEMFNRGEYVGDNYLCGKNDGIIYAESPSHIGVRVGTVSNLRLKTDFTVQKGDGFKVFDSGVEVCGAVARENGTGLVKLDFSGKVKDGMEVRRTTSVELCRQVLTAERKLPVTAVFRAYADKTLELTLTCGETSATAVDVPPKKAINQATSKQEIIDQISKTGGSCCTITDIVVQNDDIFLPKSQLNALRRSAISQLESQIVANYNENLNRTPITEITSSEVQNKPCEPTLFVNCYTVSQAKECSGNGLKVICKLENINQEAINELKLLKNVYLDVPSFASNKYVADLIKDTSLGVVAHNIGTVQMAREMGAKYILGTGMNVFNDECLTSFADCDTYFYSQELTLREISAFCNPNGVIFTDGELTLMKFVHCPFKAHANSTCKNCKCGALTYRDELGNVFNVKRRRADICTFELVNGKKLSAAGKITTRGRYAVDYDRQVISHYQALNSGEPSNYVETKPYTKGRLFDKIN